jgi:hypothetical protein
VSERFHSKGKPYFQKGEALRQAFTLSLLVLVSAAAAAQAQTKFTMSGKCLKPDVQQAVPAGDAPGHMLTLAEGKCTPVKPSEVAGSPSKEATFAEQGDVKGDKARVWGMYAETLANGEKVFYRYEGTSVLANGAVQSMKNKWQIEGGTDKLKGIKGQGTCNGKGTPDGGLAFDCTGEYTLATK